MDEDYGAVFRENNVGTTWQISTMEPVTEAEREESAADEALRLRVLPTNLRHAVAALSGCQHVGHFDSSV